VKTYFIVVRPGETLPYDDDAACKTAGVPTRGYFGTRQMADRMRRRLETVTGLTLATETWVGVHPATEANGAYFDRQTRRSRSTQ